MPKGDFSPAPIAASLTVTALSAVNYILTAAIAQGADAFIHTLRQSLRRTLRLAEDQIHFRRIEMDYFDRKRLGSETDWNA